ncbi:hypothetical protein HPB47_015541 [Ixodes persulcatus]|uniref:Uncharacterized protein n=1 Tax=Ixodes persulcatus TaxID=34615 RepID=A0AC60QT74_IXOPE|nr:hypothetical protein HPB47_015541 [Ixodes persulcatus]
MVLNKEMIGMLLQLVINYLQGMTIAVWSMTTWTVNNIWYFVSPPHRLSELLRQIERSIMGTLPSTAPQPNQEPARLHYDDLYGFQTRGPKDE